MSYYICIYRELDGCMFLPHLKHFPDVFRQPVDPESMPSTIPTATWGQDSSCLMVYGITNKRHGGPISWHQRSHHCFFFVGMFRTLSRQKKCSFCNRSISRCVARTVGAFRGKMTNWAHKGSCILGWSSDIVKIRMLLQMVMGEYWGMHRHTKKTTW